VLSKSRIFKFLKRDCGTIPVAEITSGKIEIFSKHQRFLIATDSSKYLLIFVLYVCVAILCEFGNNYRKTKFETNATANATNVIVFSCEIIFHHTGV
jgi:hypothetical protein